MTLRDKFKSDDKPRLDFAAQLIRLIIDEIGTFKGPAMKIGQMLAGLSLLPGDVRIDLQRSLSTTRQLKPEVFTKVFMAEHGRRPEEVFRNWRPDPIGVGSMGQVFLAELPSGQPVAVKITYPNLTKLVRADLKILRMLLPILRPLILFTDMDGLYKVFEELFLGECDLRQEAAKHQFMYETYGHRDDIRVPKLYPEYTSASVMVTEFIGGMKMFEYATKSSLTEKRRLMDIIAWVYGDAISEHCYVQADPHCGNYLVHDGKVVILDCGSLLKVSAANAAMFRRSYELMWAGDVPTLRALWIEAKYIDPTKFKSETIDFLVGFMVNRIQRRWDIDAYDISKLMEPYFKDNAREGIYMDPYFFLIIFSSFMQNTLIHTAEVGLVDEELPQKTG